MRNLFLLFLFFSAISSAQKYAGKWYNPEIRLGYNVLFIIRPDSTISLTFETINPPIEKRRKKSGDEFDKTLYYDFHGNIQKTRDSSFHLDVKGIFSFELRDSPTYDGYDRPVGSDTMLIWFDSVFVRLNRKVYASYGNVRDSIYRKTRWTDLSTPVTKFYDSLAITWGYPKELRDSAHTIFGPPIYLPINQAQFQKAKAMLLDIGYVNPVSHLPVLFTVPYGKYPYCQGDFGGQFNIEIKNNKVYLLDGEGTHAYPNNLPVVLSEFK